jgi:hypothetical protein
MVLSKAGDHTPVYPLREMVGSGANTSPLQIGGMSAKEGIMF